MKPKSKQSTYSKRKKPKTLTLCENNSTSTKKLNNKEYPTEILNKNKKLKYNNSLTTFNNKTYINKKIERKLMPILSSSQLEDIKNDIYSFHTNAEQKKLKSSSNLTNKSKNDMLKKNNINYENRYEIYNKDNLAYQIYHDYQKLKFNDENLNFIERMNLYGYKKSIKDIKVNEYINIKSPKLSEKERKKIFDHLIKDCEHRKKKMETLNQNINRNSRKVSKKRIDEIVNRLYNSKKNKKIKLHSDKKKENNKESNLDDKKRKSLNDKENNKSSAQNIKTINKCNSQRNMNKIYELNKRLYYNELNKKDIPYKLFLQKVNELLGINDKNFINKMIEIPAFSNYNERKNNINNDFLSFSELVNLRKAQKYNERQDKKYYPNRNKLKEIYNFKDDSSLVNSNKEKNKKINNENSKKDISIKLDSNKINEMNNNDEENKNNALFSLSNKNNINNLKISIIIENFFCNK